MSTWPPTIYGNDPPQCTDGCAMWETWCTRYGLLGNAKDWPENWAKHGGPFSPVPVVDAVACFPPGVDGADEEYGHVAVVRFVGNGVFTVEEMNGPAGPGHMDTRICATAPGIDYMISGTPAPAPPAPTPPSGGTIWVNFGGVVDVETAFVRGGPSQANQILRELHHGAALGFDGYAYGPAIWDDVAHQWDHRWFHIDKAHGYGWIASAIVNGNPPNSHP